MNLRRAAKRNTGRLQKEARTVDCQGFFRAWPDADDITIDRGLTIAGEMLEGRWLTKWGTREPGEAVTRANQVSPSWLWK